MATIFDTDFDPDDKVLLYVGNRYHWEGYVKDMTEEDKQRFDTSEWFLLANVENAKALFMAGV